MKIIQIYVITNICNNKKYVGFTEIGLKKRWAKHLKDSQNPKYPIHRAIAKYGHDNFTIASIYESMDKHHISELEEYFILAFDSRNNGYNVALGGRGGDLGPAANHKRSQTVLNRTEEEKAYWRKILRPIRQQAQHKPEVKQKTIARMKGNKFALGHRHSEDLKIKFSQDRIGKAKSDVTRQRMALAAKQNGNGKRFYIRCSCLCCQKEWDIGNYTQHINRGAKK